MSKTRKSSKAESDAASSVCVCDLAQSAVESCEAVRIKVEQVRAVAQQIKDCCTGKGKKTISVKKENEAESDNEPVKKARGRPKKAEAAGNADVMKVYATQAVQKKIAEAFDGDWNLFEYVGKSECDILVADTKPKRGMPEDAKWKNVKAFLKLLGSN